MATKKKTKSTEPTTYYVLVLDESGSMSHLTEKVKTLYKQKVNDLFDSAEQNNQKVRASFLKFGDNVNTMVVRGDRESMLDNFVVNSYRPDGMTRLLDAVQEAISITDNVRLNPNDAVLIEVITDGLENRSKNITKSGLATLINTKQNTGQYSFIFQLPPGHRSTFLREFPLFSDNVREWEGTVEGFTQTHQATSQAYSNYMGTRKAGGTQTCSFYADIDASNIDKSDLKKLDNVTARFKQFSVKHEVPIKDFVEGETGLPFVLGAAKYQLSKEEVLRPGREIFISEKGKRTIYGGKGVRKLLGLPETGNVKVNPFNLSHYNIYLQSSSVNRKLVRGTNLLIDVTKTKNSAPTWGTV